ncbi:hypothetical protein SmJEL517_g00491 [Synchytrium microbalum]|uniref:NAD(P)-binding domain-containing protein n=1 Tax=Synchytrium microbalum TaxID=1806994 RepID=A0A507CD40_9FUNG|nr:uncharacterized protein SmJEL517_g00491 [Synchytrium microbalum]TPX37532.1 hypothetical protein SmJEL517_g00491 [Synchytrium microbalum]
MKLAVFGGTAGVGLEVVQQALEAGHSVNVLARSPEKLSHLLPADGKLTIITGDVLKDFDAVKHTVEGADAVIVSLGNRPVADTEMQGKTCSIGQEKINEAMIATGVKRVLVVTSMGVGDSIKDVTYMASVFITTVLAKAIADKEIQEASVRSSGLDYTILRPTGLASKPKTGGKYLFAEHIYGPTIARADVAEICLKMISSAEYVGRTFGCVGA